MSFSIDLFSHFLNNIYQLDVANEDTFRISLNNESVDIPLLLAAGFSTKVTKLLFEENTARNMEININFRNKDNISKILAILE